MESAFELRVVDVFSGTVTRLAAGPGIKPIGFSPEGDRILFSMGNVAGSLWSANADGSGAQLLVTGTSWGDWQWLPADP